MGIRVSTRTTPPHPNALTTPPHPHAPVSACHAPALTASGVPVESTSHTATPAPQAPGDAASREGGAPLKRRTRAMAARGRQRHSRTQLKDVDRRPAEAARPRFEPRQPQGAGDRAGLYRREGRIGRDEHLAAQGGDARAGEERRHRAGRAEGLTPESAGPIRAARRRARRKAHLLRSTCSKSSSTGVAPVSYTPLTLPTILTV